MIIGLLSLYGCGQDNLKTPEEFEHLFGVKHDFNTYAVDDACFDGALEILFMPEGSEQPHEFEYPIYMPLLEETPYRDTVDFREPFIGMEVEIVGDPSGELSISDSVMSDVELGGSFGDCTATMSVSALFIPGTDGFSGTAEIGLSNLQSVDASCPVPSTEACAVTLRLLTEPTD